jgi:hypothetical protein
LVPADRLPRGNLAVASCRDLGKADGTISGSVKALRGDQARD